MASLDRKVRLKARRKQPVDFGKSRRSYILDRGAVIDHKTGKQIGDVRRVLDGDLDSLK